MFSEVNRKIKAQTDAFMKKVKEESERRAKILNETECDICHKKAYNIQVHKESKKITWDVCHPELERKIQKLLENKQ